MHASTMFVLLLAFATSHALSIPSPLDYKCATLHCAKPFASCTADKMCRQNFECVAKCWEKWDSDNTSQKVEIQNCTSACTFSYEDDAYDKVMECLGLNNCMKFPPIPSTCKGPNNIKIQKNIPVSEIAGGWWVLRGYNPIYDCYPCQKNYFKPGNPNWTYTADYQVYLVNGTLKSISQSGPVSFRSNGESRFNISYLDAGLMNNESWWIFDRINDSSSGSTYFLIYYCGNVLEWNFEGAIIYSQSTTISSSAILAITNSYKANVGLDFSNFCSPKVEGCLDL